MTTRTTTLLALPLALAALLPLPAAHAQDGEAPPRIEGELTADTFDGFAAFMEKNEDGKVFGLDVGLTRRDDDREGEGREGLAAYDDGSGLLVIYKPGAPTDEGAVQISAREGVEREGDRFRLEGTFTTEFAGMGQGITAILLKPAAAPAGTDAAAFRPVPIGELPGDAGQEG